MDYLPARQIIEKNSDLTILDGFISEDAYGIAVKKENEELLKTINEVLEKLMNENKIEEYIIKYSE